MKKLILGITLSSLILLSTIFILSKNKKTVNENIYYTIPRILTYHYEENKKMCFEVFGNNENTLIEFVEENSYYLIDDKSSYQLQDVLVTKEKDYTTKEETFFKYIISCNLLHISNEDMIFNDCSLKVVNDTFTLECYIGDIAIYHGDYHPLEFNDLYGNYAYIHGELHMVGFTIQLDEMYKKLSNISIGPAYVDLTQIEQVCEVADALKAKGETNINYTSIAIKLLLTKYKCPNAKVLVDGKELNFKKVWFASAMNGQYYGGGMMVAPKQDRLSDKLSFVIMRKACRLNALLTFSKIFKGEHLKKKKYCTLIEAKHIEVTFDRPTALQIDGEVVSNVTHYEAWK